MDRRAILTLCGLTFSSTLGGCLGTDRRQDNASGSNTDTATIGIEGVSEDPPPSLPVMPEVSIVTAQASETTRARIGVGWENTGEKRVRIGEATSIVFAATKSEDGRGQLLGFDQIGDRSDSVAFENCWYIADELGFDAGYDTVDLDPGERHGATPALFASDNTCLASTSYRFENRIAVEERYGWDEQTTEWGFSLDIDGN